MRVCYCLRQLSVIQESQSDQELNEQLQSPAWSRCLLQDSGQEFWALCTPVSKGEPGASPSTASPYPCPPWFPPWFWSGTAASQLLNFHELQRQLLLFTDHPGHQVKFKLSMMYWCCWQDVHMRRAGEIAFLLNKIRYIAIFRDVKYPTEIQFKFSYITLLYKCQIS